MAELPAVKTMRLRYPGTCSACGTPVEQGEVAHYLPALKKVRCTSCGAGGEPAPPYPTEDPVAAGPPAADPVTSAPLQLVQASLPRSAVCDDCQRRLSRGSDAVFDPHGSAALCLDCVMLDTAHVLGIPGAGARREHAKRLERHHTQVRTRHPRLGGLILALKDDPQHIRAWQGGAVGEEAFGHALSAMASESLKVLHDRKLPRSSANIDHLAVTTAGVWILDSKRYDRAKVETRGHGLFSRRPPDLYVGGRNKMKLVEGLQHQLEVVRGLLDEFAADHRLDELPVRGALVFIDAEFGLFASPISVEGIWVGWGKAMRAQLSRSAQDGVPVAAVAKYLARTLRAG